MFGDHGERRIAPRCRDDATPIVPAPMKRTWLRKTLFTPSSRDTVHSDTSTPTLRDSPWNMSVTGFRGRVIAVKGVGLALGTIGLVTALIAPNRLPSAVSRRDTGR